MINPKLFTIKELFSIFIYHIIFLLSKYTNNDIIKQKKLLKEIAKKGFKIKLKNNIFRVSNPKVNIELRKGASDIYVFEQIFVEEEYAPVINIIKKHNIEVNNIIDLGGNIGLSSVYFSQYIPNAKYVILEPFNENFRTLTNNFNNNNNIDTKYCFNAGIWNKDCKLKIDRSFRDGKEWAITLKEIENEKSGEIIDGYSIQTILNKTGISTIDILKMDIEGGEAQIFDLKNSNVDFLKNTKIITIEIHEEFIDPDKIVSILKSFGFDTFNSGELTIGINKNLITSK